MLEILFVGISGFVFLTFSIGTQLVKNLHMENYKKAQRDTLFIFTFLGCFMFPPENKHYKFRPNVNYNKWRS